MAERGKAYFEEANRLGGLQAKIRLATLARVTSTEATSSEDTSELLGRLQEAMVEVRATFRQDVQQPGNGVGKIAPASPGSDQSRALRKYLLTACDLMAQRSLFLVDLDATVRRITEAAASALDVDRVSVWFLDERRTKIACADLYERSTKKHSSGIELHAKDFGAYFTALESERTIAANDAHTDPRTSCFSASYLTPLGIGSMLDVPIWLGPKMVGVVCHEHVGPQRTWNSDEESFAYLMSNVVALALERSGRKPG